MELLPKEAHKKVLYLAFYILIAVFGTYFFFEYALSAVLPFALAFFLAASVQKNAELLARRTGGSKRVFSLVLGLSFFILAALALGFASYKLVFELSEFVRGIADAREELLARVVAFAERAEAFFARFLPLGAEDFRESFSSLLTEGAKSLISALTTSIPAFLGAVFAGVPKLLFFLTATFISCVYFCLDYDKLRDFARKNMARSSFAPLLRVPGAAFRAAAKYLRAVFLLFLLVAIVFTVGFLLLGVEYACLFAVLAAFVDALPALGSGAVLLPYAVFAFATGDFRLGLGMCVLWGTASLVRQVAEPKIMGGQLGVHPLVNLAAVYVGYRFFGVTGLMFMPIAVVIVKNIVQNEECRAKN
ncbi:MAG: AI-2E family transporter [Clostridia bacterium]|nr:AI-2E family transporter [Clostridia bacterium]